MRNFENLKNPCVIYHGECTDGFGAAFAARKVFGDDATYIPGHHGKGIPEGIDGKDIVILDFSFKRKDYFEILERANSVQLIDHHASAMKELEGAPGVFFDMSKSGARLAWEAFVGKDIPDLILHIEDIDLWKFEMEGTKQVFYGLDSLPMEFDDWSPYLEGNQANSKVKELMIEGRGIEKWVMKQVAEMVQKALPIELLGVKGLAMNGSRAFVNELGSQLAKESGTFGLVWHENTGGGMKCSLRSGANFDSSEIAVAFGGGGHKTACAFQIPKEQFAPFRCLQTLEERRKMTAECNRIRMES